MLRGRDLGTVTLCSLCCPGDVGVNPRKLGCLPSTALELRSGAQKHNKMGTWHREVRCAGNTIIRYILFTPGCPLTTQVRLKLRDVREELGKPY